MRDALIVYGGWEGHTPKESAEIVAAELRRREFRVELSDTLDAYLDIEKLKALHLIVPCWTMGKIEGAQEKGLLAAIREGTGVGGWHGGMCDSFRQNVEYQFMTGGNWVAHPGGQVTYKVHITDREHEITRGLEDFELTSEQYYLHVDPAVKVLATTNFEPERVMGNTGPDGGDVIMPVTWTKLWGKARVFYTSLGHVAKTVAEPPVLEMIARGLVWAAREE